MDVDAMDELMYDTLVRYFKTLAYTGYKSYDVVFKILVMDFIYDITNTELRYYITDNDIKLMQDLLYQFFGSTCEISFPTNNKCCCVCPDPSVTTTTTSTPAPEVTTTTTTTTTTSSTTTTSTPAPFNYTLALISEDMDCNITGIFGNYKLANYNVPVDDYKIISVASSEEPSGSIGIVTPSDTTYSFNGIYDADTDQLLSLTLPYIWKGNAALKFKFASASTTTTSTTTTSTTSTPLPYVTYRFAAKSTGTNCTITDGIFAKNSLNNTVVPTGGGITISESLTSIPTGSIYDISYDTNNYTFAGVYNTSTGQLITEELPYKWQGNTDITFMFVDKGSTTTTTTTTSTSTTPPAENVIYYGTASGVAARTFMNMSVSDIMSLDNTKARVISSDGINEFTVPQDIGTSIQYLLVPSSMVELQYAGFTDSSFETVYYDYSKENIAGDTNNGTYFSKYTRGGVNCNPGGTYKGINYDVYFMPTYLDKSIDLTIKAKRK